MNNIISCGLICVRDELNIEYVVSKIEYILNKDGSFKYIFTPYYNVIDLIDSSIFQGLPGIELDLKKETYVRDNITPTFISERVPSENRENYYELLESVKLDYMDPIQFLIRTKSVYSGDNLYVKEYEHITNLVVEDNAKKCNSFGIVKMILDNIAKGNIVTLRDGTKLNRKDVFNCMKLLCAKSLKEISSKQKEGIKAAKQKDKYKGRKPIDVDKMLFLEQYEKVLKGEISSREAAEQLGISIDKYYRFKKSL